MPCGDYDAANVHIGIPLRQLALDSLWLTSLLAEHARDAGAAGEALIAAELLTHPNREVRILDDDRHLMDIYGIGPAGAARILADVGDVARFPDRNHFGSWTGTAPIDASSGAQIRHRLSRAGNRRINHVLHIAAVCSSATTPTDAPTTGPRSPPGRPRWRRSAV